MNKKKRFSRAIPLVCTTTGEIFLCGAEAAEKLGLKKTNISKVLFGHYKTTHGYHFRYATEEEASELKRKIKLQTDCKVEKV